jgi:phage gpG-like protein
MFRISAKAFFDNRTADNALFLDSIQENLPREVLVEYNKIARAAALEPMPSGGTPFRRGGLRRSIVTDVRGDTAYVGWRIPYAANTNAGVHSNGRKIQNWTTPNTGGGFMERTQTVADQRIQKEIPQILRKLGLTP